MNKSLILRKKLYRFCFLLFSFIMFTYIFYFIINGERGIISFYKITKKHSILSEKINFLVKENTYLENNISRLSPNNLDLDYLDEQLRLKTGKTNTNEIVIKLDN